MKNKGKSNLWIFFMELVVVSVIPFVIAWSKTPTNILNSAPLFKLLETIGLGGSVFLFFFGIPMGIIGIASAKKAEKLRIPTMVLSIINLCVGILEVGLLLLIFLGVVFGGITV